VHRHSLFIRQPHRHHAPPPCLKGRERGRSGLSREERGSLRAYAKRYEGKIKGGNILLSVHAESSEEIDRAKEIFKQAGADDISYTAEASVSAPRKVAAR
ncbi:MAG: hypothetical protein KBF50_08580, partial [Steroidobacteraceae bacterium]|nr:hypothetical protein [Steroidobacteraceae bacterium]